MIICVYLWYIQKHNAMTRNEQKMLKVIRMRERTRELFHEKYTREDWDNNKIGTRSFYRKCEARAYNEVFGN